MVKKIHIIPHTHWDREWYLTFGEYRSYLVRVLDHILNSLKDELNFFLLDGQTSAIMDYLAIKPEKEIVVKELVSRGKLAIGPWFTQPDEFLVSGESLIRNLQMGLSICEKLGKCFKIGYLPDIFGHTPQLPQILNGFGIDTFLFSRGYDGVYGCDFIWEAPDGSKVFSRYLPDGYCNGELLGFKEKRIDDLVLTSGPYGLLFPYFSMYFFEKEIDVKRAVKKIDKIVGRYSKCSELDAVIVMNGCDHLPLQPKLSEIIRELKKKYEEVVIGGLESFFDQMKKQGAKLKTFRGELRKVKHRPILTEVLSARTYLKQLNFKAEKLLTAYLEPISLIMEELGLGEYPERLLEELWTKLLENHAHDSICGTSVDEVHIENEARFNHVVKVANTEFIARLERIGNATRVEPPKLIVFNPNPWPTTGPVEFIVPSDVANGYVGKTNGEEFKVLWLDELEFEGKKFSRGLFVARNVDGLGYETYKLLTGRKGQDKKWVSNLEFRGEKYIYRINLNRGGSVEIIKKDSEELLGEFLIFVDDGDVGDEYNYDAPSNNYEVSSYNLNANLLKVKYNEDVARVELLLEMEIPKHTTRKGRSEEKVKIPIIITFNIYRELDRVDVDVELENMAENHRLRVLNKINFEAPWAVEELHFYENKREIKQGEPRKMPWSIEVEPRVHPYHDYLYIKEGNKGIMFSSRGLYEYSAVRKKGLTLVYLTLFRSVGYLSRGDLKSRRGHAGPGIPTPGAQCKRIMKFQFSIIPFEDHWDAVKKAKNFTQPMIAVFSTEKGVLPEKMTFLKIDGESYMFTAFKKSSDWNSKIIRVANLKGVENSIKIEVDGELYESDLFERTDALKTRIIGENLKLKPYKIHTILIKQSKNHE